MFSCMSGICVCSLCFKCKAVALCLISSRRQRQRNIRRGEKRLAMYSRAEKGRGTHVVYATRRGGNGWMDRGTSSWRSGTAMWAGTRPAASCCWAAGGPEPGGKQSCCQHPPAPGNFAFNMKHCKEILQKVYSKILFLEIVLFCFT